MNLYDLKDKDWYGELKLTIEIFYEWDKKPHLFFKENGLTAQGTIRKAMKINAMNLRDPHAASACSAQSPLLKT
jgi:hypothetical protein